MDSWKDSQTQQLQETTLKNIKAQVSQLPENVGNLFRSTPNSATEVAGENKFRRGDFVWNKSSEQPT